MALLCACCCTLAFADPESRFRSDSARSKPVIYLTFDDGPSADDVTERLLALLASHNAKATFFVTGERARARPGMIGQIVAAGHALGNHTHSHGRLTTLQDYTVVEELDITNKHVLKAGGPQMSCFRAPFGDTDFRVNSIARSMGLNPVGWDIDTRDWDYFTATEHVAVQLEDSGHNSVVLMHDGPLNRWRTLEALTTWMEDTGHLYDFKAVPKCTQPYSTTFAKLEKPAAPLGPDGDPEVTFSEVVETIPSLIAKLRDYEFALLPAVEESSLKISRKVSQTVKKNKSRYDISTEIF